MLTDRLGRLGLFLWSGWAGLAALSLLAALWQIGHEAYGDFILPAPAATLRAGQSGPHGRRCSRNARRLFRAQALVAAFCESEQVRAHNSERPLRPSLRSFRAPSLNFLPVAHPAKGSASVFRQTGLHA